MMNHSWSDFESLSYRRLPIDGELLLFLGALRRLRSNLIKLVFCSKWLSHQVIKSRLALLLIPHSFCPRLFFCVILDEFATETAEFDCSKFKVSNKFIRINDVGWGYFVQDLLHFIF